MEKKTENMGSDMMKKIGDGLERVGEAVEKAGLPGVGQKISNLGDQVEHSKAEDHEQTGNAQTSDQNVRKTG